MKMHSFKDAIRVHVRELPIVVDQVSSIIFTFELQPLLGATFAPADEVDLFRDVSREAKSSLETSLAWAGEEFLKNTQEMVNIWASKVAEEVIKRKIAREKAAKK